MHITFVIWSALLVATAVFQVLWPILMFMDYAEDRKNLRENSARLQRFDDAFLQLMRLQTESATDENKQRYIELSKEMQNNTVLTRVSRRWSNLSIFSLKLMWICLVSFVLLTMSATR